MMMDDQPSSPQSLYAGLWRTDQGLVSIAHLKNVLESTTLEITPTLYMEDGTSYLQSSVSLPPKSNLDLNLNQILAAVPAAWAGHLSPVGSLELSFAAPAADSLAAVMDIEDGSNQSYLLGFSLGPTAPATNPPANVKAAPPGASTAATAAATQRLNAWQARNAALSPRLRQVEASWWLRDDTVAGWFSLANTTSTELVASYWAMGAKGSASASRSVTLPPHGVTVVPLGPALAGLPDAEQNAGGLIVNYVGLRGALLVTGGLFSAQTGICTDLRFLPRSAPGTTVGPVTLGVTGMRLGPGPAALHLSEVANFHPYARLRNTTEQAIPISVVLTAQVAGAAPLKFQLPPQLVLAHQTVDLDFKPYLSQVPGGEAAVNLDAAYSGNSGDVLILAGSVDEKIPVVLQAAVKNVSPALKIEMPQWSIANGADTIFAFWNPTALAQDLAFILTSADGTQRYTVPVNVAPNASAEIDLSMVAASGHVDAAGNPFPSATSGSAVLQSARVPAPDERGYIKLSSPGSSPLIEMVTDSSTVNNTANLHLAQAAASPRPQLAADGFHADDFAWGCGYEWLEIYGYPSIGVGEGEPMSLIAFDCSDMGWDISSDASWYSDSYGLVADDAVASCSAVGTGEISAGALEYWEQDDGSDDFMSGDGTEGPMLYTEEDADTEVTCFPIASGGGDVWWFGVDASSNPNTVSGYSAYQTASVDGGEDPTYDWYADSDVALAGLYNPDDDYSEANVDFYPTGEAFSSTAGDACVYALVNGVASNDVCYTIREPYTLSSDDFAVQYFADPSGYGFNDYYPWFIYDQLGNPLAAETPFNEFFDGFAHDNPLDLTVNWPPPTAGYQTSGIYNPQGSETNYPNFFYDELAVASSTYTPPPGYSSACSIVYTNNVMHIYQTWRIGTFALGYGASVQRDMLHYYQTCAEPESITSPYGG